jgi:hypothetical protein
VPEQTQQQTIICEGGLDNSENHLALSDGKEGTASRLVNFEVGEFGGYRRIEGYALSNGANTGAGTTATQNSTLPGTGPVLGVFVYVNQYSQGTSIIAARQVASSGYYSFYQYRANDSWVLISDNARVNNEASKKYRPSVMTFGPTARVNNGSPSSSTTVTIDEVSTTITTSMTMSAVDSSGDHVFEAVSTGRSDSGDIVIATAKTINDNTRLQFSTGVGITNLHITQFNDGDGNKVCITDGINPAVIYYSDADGHTFEQLVSTGNGNSTNTSNEPPLASSGVNDGYGGANAINAPVASAYFKQTLFIAGDQTPTQSTGSVAAGVSGKVEDFGTGGAVVTTEIDVVNIKPFRNDLYVFGVKAIKKITTSGTDFVLENVTNNLGCVAPDSIVELGGDLIFLSQDGFRPVAGTSRIGDLELESLSKSIQSDLIHLRETYDLNRLVSVVVPSKSQVRYFLNKATPTDVSVADSEGFIGGLRTADKQVGWEWGRLRGIRANCTAHGYLGSDEYVIHGDHDGIVYRQEFASSTDGTHDFAGSDIVAIYETPYMDMGDPLVRKTVRKIDAFIRAEGSLTLGVALDFDYGDPDLFRPADMSEVTEGAIVKFDRSGVTFVDDVDDTSIFLYGGQTKPVLSYHVSGSGNSVQFRFISNGKFAPFSIQGLIVKFTTSGKQ